MSESSSHISGNRSLPRTVQFPECLRGTPSLLVDGATSRPSTKVHPMGGRTPHRKLCPRAFPTHWPKTKTGRCGWAGIFRRHNAFTQRCNALTGDLCPPTGTPPSDKVNLTYQNNSISIVSYYDPRQASFQWFLAAPAPPKAGGRAVVRRCERCLLFNDCHLFFNDYI